MADEDSILSVASSLRSGIPCSFADEAPRHGGGHSVFKLIFEDSVQWAARPCKDKSLWKFEIQSVTGLQEIKRCYPDMKAPALFFKEGYPVLYSEWVSGETIGAWSNIPFVQREKILDEFAEFLLQLWSTKVPAGPKQEGTRLYSAWLKGMTDEIIREFLDGKPRFGNVVDYLIMRSMIPDYVGDLDNYPDIGFDHGDLNAGNVMLDDKFKIAGIIDWDFVHVAPLPAIIHHPWFIADIPGSHVEAELEEKSCAADRLCLEEKLIERESSFPQTLPYKLSTLLKDSRKRLFFQAALGWCVIHGRFVDLHCQKTKDNINVARSQLEEVLILYPGFRDGHITRDLQNLLQGAIKDDD